MRIVLPALVGLVVLLGSAGAAQARTEFVNTDDQILDLGVMPDELRVDGDGEGAARGALLYDHVGFFYKRVGILGADVWSWSGKLVFYRQTPEITHEAFNTVETTYYVEIDDETAERYGWKTPIEYRIPVGLLVAACLAEFAFVARRRRRAKWVLSIGIGLVVLAAVLYFLGMTWQVAFPLLLGVFHIVIALPYFQPATNAETAAAMEDEPDPPFAPKPAPERASGRLLPPPPNVETDPFRAPPQPPPIAVRAPTAPAAAPVVRDDNADAPKLLR